MEHTLSGRARFGPFELDLRAGELHWNGQTVLLPEQPFQVLRILIERNGEIATREEIKKQLWPNDTVVEFDHGINNTVKKLRRALDDSAEDPKYIETLARRGYRLMVPVEWVEEPGDDTSSGESSDSEADAVPKAKLRVGRLTGKTISHYRVLEIIGGGGMGLVYRAEDLKLGRAVALKFLPEEVGDDPRPRERFEREAHAVSALDHPNICTVYEFDEYQGHPFIAMQLLHGETLREYLAEGRFRLSSPEGLEVAIQVAAGLEAAHEKGIIHRDIKPANIFITEKNVAKILDFGVAKVLATNEPAELAAAATGEQGSTSSRLAPNLTRTGLKLGTAGYMSPEQVRGETLDVRTDIFSFGLVLYEMAAGERAFTGETEAILHDAIVNREPIGVHDLNSALSPTVEKIVNRAIEKEREKRYQSTSAMRSDFEDAKQETEGLLLKRKLRTSWKLLATAALLALAIVAGVLYRRARSAAKPSVLHSKDTVVVADFANSTGDAIFDGTLKQALSTQLEQSPFLNVLSDQRVGDTLHDMNRPPGARLTTETAREVCLRTNSKAVVAGSIAPLGDNYYLVLKAVNCISGDTLASAQAEAQNRNNVLQALSDTSNGLREKLGESLASAQKLNMSLSELGTTSSLEALQAWTQGVNLKFDMGNGEAAIPYFQRAIQLDPNFASAYLNLGVLYLDAGRTDEGLRNVRTAYELREHVSRAEQLVIEGFYHKTVTGELEITAQLYEEWARLKPDTPWPYMNLSSVYDNLAQYEKAVAADQQVLRLGLNAGYESLLYDYLDLNRLAEADAVLTEAESHKFDSARVHTGRYWVALCRNDTAAVQQELALIMATPEGNEWAMRQQGSTALFYGRFRAARQYYSTLKSYAPNSASTLVGDAEAALETGNLVEARKKIAAALNAHPDPSLKSRLAVLCARTGNVKQAQELAAEIDKKSPLSTLVQKCKVPSIRAAIALNSNPALAIRLLEPATPYELSDQEGLVPIYLRGLAYLKLGRGREAATEFQKMVDHPGILLDSIESPLSHLYLGRAQAMMGDKAAARKSYGDFLTLWKDADPDIPIYKQAKAEYAKLR